MRRTKPGEASRMVGNRKLRLENTREGDVVRAILNDPPGNVLDSVMMDELLEMIAGLGSRPEVKLVQFEGEGDHFSYGASVEEHVREKVAGMLGRFHRVFLELSRLAIPTLALVRGRCLGGGMELAAFCNVVVAEEGASFGQPEIKLGVFPPVAALLLSRRCGQGRADEMCLTGTTLSAGEAHRVGLVDHLVEPGSGREFVDRWTLKNVLPLSASSLRFAQRACRASLGRQLETELPRLEALYLEELMATSDGNEGIASFLEKRKPAWRNR
jgi:cyclohexa-1,5-dienecarbonyl-CoA hydratase